MARCFVTRRLPGPALDRLKAVHEVAIWQGRLPPTPTELAQEARDAEGLLTLLTDRVDESLLREADFVSWHCPLTPETHHLIDAEALELMSPTAILINTARGPIVDPQALKDALERGQIAAAALDVTEPEPLPAGDPLLTTP